MDCTSEDGYSQTKLTYQEHVPERIIEQIIDVLMPLPILEELVSMKEMAPHEHAQTSHECTAADHQQGSWRSREGTETSSTVQVEMR